LLVGDAVDGPSAFIGAAVPEHAELASSQRDVAKLLGCVEKGAVMTDPAVSAFHRIVIEKRLGGLHACHRQVMRLDQIAVIFSDSQVDASCVESSDDNDRQQGETPEQGG